MYAIYQHDNVSLREDIIIISHCDKLIRIGIDSDVVT